LGKIEIRKGCIFLGEDDTKDPSLRHYNLGNLKIRRFMLAPGWEFPYDVSLLNAKAMMDAATLYGKYA